MQLWIHKFIVGLLFCDFDATIKLTTLHMVTHLHLHCGELNVNSSCSYTHQNVHGILKVVLFSDCSCPEILNSLRDDA